MSAYEYLTVNSLTAYPFRDSRAENAIQPIASDVFLDLTFTLYTPNIFRPYIKQLSAENGNLTITFHDVVGDAFIFDVYVPAAEVVSHYKNFEKSFFGYKPASYYPNAAVKFVFGVGIQKLVENSLTVQYTYRETELSPSVVQYSVPEVSTLNFEAWFPDFDSENFNPLSPQQVISVKTFLREEEVGMRYGYNNTFNYLAPNTMYLDVLRGAGLGLYDPCANLPPYDFITKINQIVPDANGNMFFKVSDCHSLRLLTDDERYSALERIAAGGKDYVNFSIPHYLYLWDGDLREDYKEVYPSPGRNINILGNGQPSGEINAVNHGFVLENYCKPKCPHENLNAFAQYLNRVKDGVAELYKIVENPLETCGKATVSGNILTATSFCQDLPAGWLEGSSCGNTFIKYFHEGRRIRIRYNKTTSYNVDIVEVLESGNGINTQIKLSQELPELEEGVEYFFKIADFGLLNKLNWEIAKHNANSELKNSAYIEFNYSTVEAFNSDDLYVSFLTTITVVYNPGEEELHFRAVPIPKNNTTLIDTSIKIRRENGEILYNATDAVVDCKSYAIFEAIFFVPCGGMEGGAEIQVIDVSSDEDLENSPKAVNIVSASCVDVQVKIVRDNARENQFWGFNFAQGGLEASDIVAISYTELPNWIIPSTNNSQGDEASDSSQKYHLYGTPTAETAGIDNIDISITATITTTGGVFKATLILSYIARPRLESPLEGTEIEIRPPDTLNRTYTEGAPLIRIVGSNNPTSYIFRSTAPIPGFSSKGNKFIGRFGYNPQATYPQTYTYKLIARNAANSGTLEEDEEFGVTITIKVYDASREAAQALQNTPYCYTLPNPNAANLSVLSTLPSWLNFNPLANTQIDPPECHLTGINTSNVSTTEKFIIRYDYGNKFENLEYTLPYLANPIITSPAEGFVVELGPPNYNPLGVSTTFTEARPVLKIVTTNLPQTITAEGLPPGFTLEVPSGQTSIQRNAFIVGTLTSEASPGNYTVTINAANAAGSISKTIILRLESSAKVATALEGTNFCYRFPELVNATQFELTWTIPEDIPVWLRAAAVTNTRAACHIFTDPLLRVSGELNKDIHFILKYENSGAPGIKSEVSYILRYIARPRIVLPAEEESFTIASENISSLIFTEENPLLSLDVRNVSSLAGNTTIDGLPAGLSLVNGKIVGTITQVSNLFGEYLVQLVVENAAGKSTRRFKINIVAETVEQAYQGTPYCYKITGLAGIAEYAYEGDKPDWLTFNPSTSATCPLGNFYGTAGPAETQNRIGVDGYNLKIIGIRATGGVIEQEYRLDYYAKPVITYPAADTIFTISPPDYNATLFTSTNPLFRISATNTPTSFRVVGFAPNTFRVDNVGNLIGSSGVTTNTVPREVFIYASNQAGESLSVRIFFIIINTTKTITFNSNITAPCAPGASYQFDVTGDRPNSIALTNQPNWIIFNPDLTSTCHLTFEPVRPVLTSSQTIPITLTRNYIGGSTRERFNLNVTTPPVITNPINTTNPANRTRYVISRPDFNNRIYSVTAPLMTVMASNSPTSMTASGLPSSLKIESSGEHMGKLVSLNNSTKVTQVGLYVVEVVASNTAGPGEPVVFEIEVKDEDIEIHTRQGTPIQGQNCKIMTRDRATSYSVVAGNLLNGLSFTGSTEAGCNFSGIPGENNFEITNLEIRSNYVGGFSNFNFKFINLSYPEIIKFTQNGQDILNDTLNISPSDYLDTIYTEENPLFVVETTGNPTSFYAEGFPLASTLSIGCSGKIIGTISEQAAGQHSVKFVAVNEAGESLKKTIVLNLSKTIPVITWPTPGEITYGVALNNEDHLNAASSVSGVFSYIPPAGNILSASDQPRTLTAIFTPDDLVNYVSVTKTNTIRVNKATPQITWSNPENIIYYTPLGANQLNATTNVSGTFIYNPSAGSRPAAGTTTLNLTFNPQDPTNFVQVQRQVQLVVEQVTVTNNNIFWNAPAALTFGTALSATQLNALARINATDPNSPEIPSNNNSYVYAPPAGTILNVGTHTLTVTFVSADPVNFTTTPVQKSVTISVLPQALPITWNNPSPIVYGTLLSTNQLNATSTVNSVTFTYTPPIGTLLNAGNNVLTLTATGNANYGATTLTRNIVVNKAESTLNFTSVASGAVGTTLELTVEKTGSSGTVTFSSQATNIISINGNIATFLRAGSATITATLAGDSNYNGIVRTQTISVGKGVSTLNITSSPTVGVGSTVDIVVAKTGSTALTTLASSDTSRLVISGNRATGLTAGHVGLTAAVASDANYNGATAQQAFTVTKGNSTVNITSTASGIETNQVLLTANKTGSTGAITFSSSNNQVVNISGNQATLGIPGTVTITAALASDNNYNSATNTQTFTVLEKSPSTLTYTGAVSGLVGEFLVLSVSKTGSTGAITYVSQNTSIATVSGSQTLSLLAAGTVTILATLAADKNYKDATTTFTITVNKKPSVISLSGNNSVKLNQPYTLTATRTGSTGAITFSSSAPAVATISNTGTVTLLSVGNVTFTATLAADNTFLGATTTKTIAVEKGDSSITLQPPLTGTVNGTSTITATKTGSSANITFSALASTGITISNSTATSATFSFTKGGTHSFTATLPSDTNYNGASVTGSITVAKDNSTVDIQYSTDGILWSSTPPEEVEFNSSLSVRAVTTGSRGFLAIQSTPGNNMIRTANCTFGNTGVCSAVFLFTDDSLGTQSIKFTLSPDNNYNGATVTDIFNVTPKPASTISLSLPGGGSLPFSISGKDQTLTVVATISGSQGPVTAYTTPNINVSTEAPIACIGRDGTCGLNFLFKRTAMQTITFEVAEDFNFKGAKRSASINVTVPEN